MIGTALLTILALTGQTTPSQDARQATFAIQVALDRAGFSTGVIDGRMGSNTRRAIDAYRQRHSAEPSPFPDPLLEYRITAEDEAGPFVSEIPADLVEQSKLPALAYRSVVEALAERFHTTPEVLQELNPSASFTAGNNIRVPNVEPLVVLTTLTTPAPAKADSNGAAAQAVGTSGRPPTPDKAQKNDKPDVIVRVSRSLSSLTVTDIDGKALFFAPVTTGSQNDPLPIGDWKVNGVQNNPTFNYNPDLFWDADPGHTKATIPPGPNGPVGLVWIDISKEHYGLHGSPEPSKIGRTESHGCVRLTNWDALRVAALVKPGTRVVFVE
jgi:lipoprotein-anchoring transpeptidase ErfK/SrfK